MTDRRKSGVWDRRAAKYHDPNAELAYRSRPERRVDLETRDAWPQIAKALNDAVGGGYAIGGRNVLAEGIRAGLRYRKGAK